MEGIDPDVLLEWLQTGMGDERDLQVVFPFLQKKIYSAHGSGAIVYAPVDGG